MSFTPSQKRDMSALKVASDAYQADMRAKTHARLMRAAAACAPFASIRDGVVVYAETKRVCINEGTCGSPRRGDEPTGSFVEWHDDDSPSRWQPTVPQWDPPTSPARSRSPTDVCYTPTAPDTEERVAKRARAASTGWD